MKIKICGMRELSNIQHVAEHKPDYMGFIFYKESPRYVGENFRLPELPEPIKTVGVFVNTSLEEMKYAATKFRLDYLQLHGSEKPQVCAELTQAGLHVIKAFAVDERFDFNVTRDYEKVADFFLFDTKGKYFGGNAASFEWDILREYNQAIPFFLSGGLNLQNIPAIRKLRDMNLHAVDLNSGVELAPAFKDVEKIEKVKRALNSMV
jgi:phosphoribosylanthranilate isomerase